jgi:predicted GIY-YIG superfamily endonuclease
MQVGGLYAVCLMASRRNGTLYVGVTNNLALRPYLCRAERGNSLAK